MPAKVRIKRKPRPQKMTGLSDLEIITRATEDPVSAMRQLVQNNLYFFLRFFWPEYSQEEFQPNWHIKYICEELEKVARRVARKQPKEYDLIINVPPGSSKTAVVSIMFPVWCWVNWYSLRFITASYTSPLSLESAEYSRDIVRSERFRRLFPELSIKDDKDTKSNFRLVKSVQVIPRSSRRTLQGGNRFSTSVGGSVTGFHGHMIIIDDPIDPHRAISEAEITKTNYWLDNTLPFRKVDKSVTPTILIMQRLAQNDPTGHFLSRKKDRVKHICIPGEIRNYIETVNPPELIENYTNDLMDPVRLDWDALKEFEELGQYTYGGQIGQDPVPLGGGMFKTDFLAQLERAPHPQLIEVTVRYWDKAATEGGDGAYTAGVKMCKTTEGKFIVLDVVRGRWTPEMREKVIRSTAEADGRDVRIYVEQEPGSGGKESALATIKNLSGFTVHADRPTGDKAVRADPMSVQVNNGNVQLLTADWNKEYIEELKFFPNSTYKDQTDASAGAFSKVANKRRVRIGGRGNKNR